MNELRWILLGLGLLLIGIIYLTSRRGADGDVNDDAAEMLQEPRLEPTGRAAISVEEGDSAAAEVRAMPALEDAVEPPIVDSSGDRIGRAEPVAKEAPAPADPAIEPAPTPVVMEKVIALHLVPRSGTLFGGVEFINALKAEGLKYDRFDIFHRFPKTDEVTENTPSLFSVANLIKPGTFNLRGLERQEFKGASMFLVLPGPEDPVAAFMDMVATGRRLATSLEGQLLDSDGTHLSRQRAGHLREEIVNYQHGITVQGNTPA